MKLHKGMEDLDVEFISAGDKTWQISDWWTFEKRCSTQPADNVRAAHKVGNEFFLNVNSYQSWLEMFHVSQRVKTSRVSQQ